jgi:vancomycin resistance protein YoaR
MFKASKLAPVLDQENTKAYLTKIADANINSKAQNATLEVMDGQVVIAKPETDGRVLDVDGTTQKISEALFDNGPRTINLNVVEQKADVRSDNYQQMGIKELIGTGTSNFVGSPQNRIHNIDVGAAKVNGALVKPGESFSLDTQLGVIDASTGYLPELVIKENKTVPEYGGGLCQIGTTTFRAALNSSLPILERQNHAYIVQYYAPTGTDATIYPPHPDVIFKNNTNGYILIQTNISGNILTFDFYGTRGGKSSKFNGIDSQDGAVDRIENVNPHVYNQQPDGSAEAEFYRFIFEGGQLTKTERFYSKYDSPSKYPH